jgi:hypothetical protein
MTTRLEINAGALYALRGELGVRLDLERRGRAVLDACGGEDAGYEMASEQGARRPQGRWRVAVYTRTEEAKEDAATNNTLIHNLSAGR